MLRTLLLLIAAVILILIGLVLAGIVNLNRQPGGGVAIETRNVEVGTTTTNVSVPVVRMEDRQVEVPSVGVQEENQAAPQ